MILQNKEKSNLLVHIDDTDEYIILNAGENIRISNKYKVYREVTTKFTKLEKTKKIR